MIQEIELDLTKNYKATLRELKEGLIKELGDDLKSLILYGSVARGDFGPESDIDILIITRGKQSAEKASDIKYDIDLKNGTFTSLFYSLQGELERKVSMGSPFLLNVMEEGKVLYDNGTWERLRQSTVN
jgi:predicted nucleotidyltransferase